MADTKISDLAAVGSLLDTDELVLARAGATKKIAASDLGIDTVTTVYDLLSDTTLGAATASFDISSISAAYKHLLLVGSIRMNSGTSPMSMALRFNNDSGANYDSHLVQVSNTTVTGPRTAAGTSAGIWLGTSADAVANMFAANELLIPDYANTTRLKNFLTRASAFSDTAADSLSWSGGGQWRSTSAIDRITILQGATDMAAGSRLTIYGLG